MNLIILINLCQNLILLLSKTFINIIIRNTGVTKGLKGLKGLNKRYKLLDEAFTLTGVGLVVIGTITGGITLNPVILGVINGSGVIVTSIAKIKNYKRKIELLQITFKTYEKILVELRSALRGDSWDKNEFIDRMKLIDDMIIDQTPLVDRFASRYSKKFNLSIN